MRRRIESMDDMERAAVRSGVLPFFFTGIRGFSIQEMSSPDLLFGDDEGCWEWKGPVIERQTAAYGKFFHRKAGFVALDLLPDFINYRRSRYPIVPGSTDEMVLDIIKANEGLTSTELRRLVFGGGKRSAREFVGGEVPVKARRGSLEAPLQRLQMGGHLLIADFTYKLDRRGNRYGWGVAVYSTPEIWFDSTELQAVGRTPEESLLWLVDEISRRNPGLSRESIEYLIE